MTNQNQPYNAVLENYYRIIKKINSNIVAISKKQPPEKILPLLKHGHRLFGENYVQEAASKWMLLKQLYPDIELHLTGQLQTNKINQAIEIFDVIETVDRLSLAEKLAAAMHKQNKYLNCFIQINTGNEPQKGGIPLGEAEQFIAICQNQLKLPIIGLMVIPTANEDPSPHFALLRDLAKKCNLANLSMGMSNDYLLASAFGATHLRIGTALFGERKQQGF